MMNVNVYKVGMEGPEDIKELQKLVDSGEINPSEIVAILGKTEGNGCVNDFTRGFSTFVFRQYLMDILNKSEKEVEEQVAFVMSGGTEGVMSPHATVFTKNEVEEEVLETEEKSLAVSVGFTRDFLPEEIGTMTMVEEVKKATLKLMEAATIDSEEDVHFVQIKCPLLTSQSIEEASIRGNDVVTKDTYESMGYSRGASALGVASALKEIDESKLSDDVILKDWSLYSDVASTSAGVELMNCEIVVMGNSIDSTSKYKMGHSVMKDAIDLEAVIEAMKNSGLNIDKLPDENDKNRIVNILAKAEASPDGTVRGRRNTMLTDSDINHTRHARAVVNGVIASIVGDPMVYVSGGAEHQGPAGGGPISVIIEKN